MDKRTKSLAKREEPHTAIRIDKTCAQKTWPLHYRRGTIASGISLTTSPSVEHPPHFPRLTPYALRRDHGTQRELFEATT
jgi:hypothetical protein